MADEENIKVKEVDGFPGWQMITDGTNRRYVSPWGGESLSRAKFDKLKNRARREGREILRSEVSDSREFIPPVKGFQTSTTATSEHPLFPPHPASDPGSHPDASAQSMRTSPPPKEERDQVQGIIDSLPEPELGSRASKKKPITAKDFADKLALGLNVGTGILGTITTIPELQIPGQKAMSMSISIAWLMDKHDMLDSPVAHAVASNEELMVWAKLGNDLYDYLSVAAPAIAAKVELMRAKAAMMRGQANGGVANTPQQTATTWEQEQALKAAAMNNGNRAVASNPDGRPIYQQNTGLRSGGNPPRPIGQ